MYLTYVSSDMEILQEWCYSDRIQDSAGIETLRKWALTFQQPFRSSGIGRFAKINAPSSSSRTA